MAGKTEGWSVSFGDLGLESAVSCALGHCGASRDGAVSLLSSWDDVEEAGAVADSAAIGMEGCIPGDAARTDVSPADGIGSSSDREHSPGMVVGGMEVSDCVDGKVVFVGGAIRTVAVET